MIALAVAQGSAQIGGFDPAFEGQLWGVRYRVDMPGLPTGVALVDGTLYVADENGNIVAAGPDGVEIPLADADWGPAATTDPQSPLFGLIPNQLGSVPIAIINGESSSEMTAILVSDLSANRVLAFDPQGRYLFTLQLDWPGRSYRGDVSYGAGVVAYINGMAAAPGSRFVYSLPARTLELEGSFAVAWAADFGRFPGAVLVYHGQPHPFLYDSAEQIFEATPHAVLTDGESLSEPFGVTFGAEGHVYFVDPGTEHLYAFEPGPSFSPLFTFGTPAPAGGTREFYEPYGLVYWPDAQGGRLFIADAVNNRIVAYRPNLPGLTIDFLFSIEGFTLDGLDNAQPTGLAVDPATGRLAATDGSGVAMRSWILQPRNLAAFDLAVFDAGGNEAESLCSGSAYSVRFGLTVPRGWAPVVDVLPALLVGGSLVPAQTTTPVTLSAGEAVFYSYHLVAPGDETSPYVGALPLLAGGTGTADEGAADALFRRGSVIIRNCANDTPPTVTLTSTSEPPQASGWTPVYAGTPFTVRLTAVDDEAVRHIRYQFQGANDLGFPIPPVMNPTPGAASQEVEIALPQPGLTTLRFRARDADFADSEWRQQNFWIVPVLRRDSFEGQAVTFSVAGPIAAGQTYSAAPIPAGMAFDEHTATFSGTPAFDAAGVYEVVVTESLGGESTTFQFRWTIADVPRAPTAAPDAYSIAEDRRLSVPAPGVLGNDSEPDDTALYALLQELPAEGLLLLDADGSFEYRAPPDFFGTVTFVYRANDGELDSEPVTVTITVNPVNEPPSFVPGSNQVVREDAGPQTVAGWATSISAGPANESDQVVSFEVSSDNPVLFASPPAISPSGTLTYQPAPNQFGTASVTVRAIDNGGTAEGGSDSSPPHVFTITVTSVNDAPVAAADSYTTIEGQTLTVPAPGVLGNDTDPDSTALSATVTSSPPGMLELRTDGSFTYTPPPAFSGTVTFSYAVSDGSAASTARVTIAVSPDNRPPVCSAATVTPSIIGPPNHRMIPLAIGGVTDPDEDRLAIRFTSILQDEPTDGPGDGRTRQDGAIARTGAGAWVRAERSGSGDGRVYLVSFEATDPDGAACAGEVRVAVPHGAGPAVLSAGRWNAITGEVVTAPPPVAVDDAVPAVPGRTTTIAVLANDRPGVRPAVSIVTEPAIGRAVVNGNGTIGYRAPHTARGTTTFSYRIATPGGAAAAQVTVTFARASDDDDRDDDNRDDDRGRDKRDRDERDRDFTVTPVNEAPLAVADRYTAIEGRTLTVPAPGVLGNDIDSDSTDLIATATSTPPGVLVLLADGSFTYTPPPAFSGTVTFRYAVSDGIAVSRATVTIVVTPDNRPPVCSAATVTPATISTPNRRPVSIAIAGVTDPDAGDRPAIRFTSILQDEPATGRGRRGGAIERNAARAWVLAERSDHGDGRVYLVRFEATDADGAACTGEVRVAVPHDARPAVLSAGRWNAITGELVSAPPPAAADDAVTVAPGKTVRIAVLANDRPGVPPAVSIVTPPAVGRAVVNANGTITYHAPEDARGATTFGYRIATAGGAAAAQITITFTPAPRDGR